ACRCGSDRSGSRTSRRCAHATGRGQRHGHRSDEMTVTVTPLRVFRALGVVVLVIWTWQFASVPMGVGVQGSVLHLPNLVFHEAGHVIFGFFGRFLTVLGGSLFQVLLPLGLAFAFLRQNDPFGAAVCTWWAGQNVLDVAPYIADARALQLVLLG